MIIPKPDGGERQLGIFTVLDRIVQQSIVMALEPYIDPSFSDSSYGFRSNRSAHDTINKIRAGIKAGRKVAVDVDLSKFFDWVNRDVLCIYWLNASMTRPSSNSLETI